MHYTSRPAFDERDAEIRERRAARLSTDSRVRVGDWVRFACGAERRVSYALRWDGAPSESIQTSAEGSGYYLGEEGVSFSGTLFRGVREEALEPTGEVREGRVWFFHHDWSEAGNGVETTIPFRVYECAAEAPL